MPGSVVGQRVKHGRMQKEQLLMGAVIALLCVAGLVNTRWFLMHTNKGRWLVRRCGETGALWVLRGVFGTGTVFGILLACNVIRPLHW